MCLAHGAVAAGATCALGGSDCEVNLVCARAGTGGAPVCTPVCDMMHPCPGARMCTLYTGTNPAGGGFCAA